MRWHGGLKQLGMISRPPREGLYNRALEASNVFHSCCEKYPRLAVFQHDEEALDSREGTYCFPVQHHIDSSMISNRLQSPPSSVHLSNPAISSHHSHFDITTPPSIYTCSTHTQTQKHSMKITSTSIHNMHIPHISSKSASKSAQARSMQCPPASKPPKQPSQPSATLPKKVNAQPCNACNIIHQKVFPAPRMPRKGV